MPTRLSIGALILLIVSSAGMFQLGRGQTTTTSVQNGDFSNGLSGWTTVKVTTSTGARGDYPIFEVLTDSPGPLETCFPSQKVGNPFLNIEVPFGADGYVEQPVAVPPSGGQLSFLSWGWESNNTALGFSGLVDAYVRIVDVNSVDHPIETYTPPPMFIPGGGIVQDVCTGNSPVLKTYDLSAYSGQTVKLRLGATSENCCGTNAFFDDVVVAPVPPTTGSLRVLVVDAHLRPVGGVTVQMTSSPEGQPLLSAQSDIHGVLEWTDISLGDYQISATKLGMAVAQSVSVSGPTFSILRLNLYLAGVENVVSINTFDVVSSGIFPCRVFEKAFPNSLIPPLPTFSTETNSCFTVQQNFLVAVGQLLFWAQNVVLVKKVGTEVRVGAVFQVWNYTNGRHDLVGCQPGVSFTVYGRFVILCSAVIDQKTTLPSIFVLKSRIETSKLIMKSNYGSFEYPLTGNAGITDPQLVLVGVNNLAKATFKSATTGNVDSFVLVKGQGSYWVSEVITHEVLKLGEASTGELSQNLNWSTDGSFRYEAGASDQGLSYYTIYSGIAAPSPFDSP